jgi:hypothetical protein
MASFRAPLLVVVPVLALVLTACEPASRKDAGTDEASADARAAAPASTHRTASAVTRWHCGELPVSTHFDDESLESITLETPERQLTLKSMADEDGARFADAAGNEFRSRPGKVTFMQVGRAAIECTKDRALTSREPR